ncbi:MAG: sigma-70 family RNA polymerase sigma factor [Acidobacteria bacterium]|nr:sigma-70 family RNA polymerase sigma factor [Acidobacteriota bacterium]
MHSSTEITQLLLDWGNGDAGAFERLLPMVEKELHRIARMNLRRINPGNTIETAALINETYLHLIEHKKVDWQNRAHFFSIAAIVMRQFLLNYLRNRNRQKRGGGAIRVTLGDAMVISDEKSDEILALEEALTELEQFDPRKAKVVELRYYGGLTVPETAAVLKISEMTVHRDWNMARAWLANRIR